jgi:trimeric autotransporter adhesin
MKKHLRSLGFILAFSTGANVLFAQTITAPLGQSLTVTNPIDVTVAGGSVNVPADGSFNFGTKKILSVKGVQNVFVGEFSGQSITGGTGNSFIGGQSGAGNTSGDYNVGIGYQAGANNLSGSYNSFIGSKTGFNNTTGSYNLFMGTYAGFTNTGGSDNIFIGKNTGYYTSTGGNNSFLGNSAGQTNTIGLDNVFLGNNAGLLNLDGNRNAFVGLRAGQSNTSGSDNTFIGYSAQGAATILNATAIGSNAYVSTSNTVVLGQNATTVVGQGLASGSGLRLNINSGSAHTVTGGSNKVLSVDGSGNVILVQLSTGVSTLSAEQPVSDNSTSKTDNSSQAFKIDDGQAKALDSKIKDLDVRLTNIAKEKNTWKEDNGFLYNNSTKGVVIKGTGFDGNALVIKGKMLSEEVNVMQSSESWPDYVFQPSYKRMSLDEVEKFISVNKHLPNVPSAAEMAITGNNLGKTDVKLLEKVEELTLYLLEMKKTNDAQSAELQSLKNQMNKLKKNRK